MMFNQQNHCLLSMFGILRWDEGAYNWWKPLQKLYLTLTAHNHKLALKKRHKTSVPSSLKTGAVRRYCRILRSLSKGHSTFFHVMNSITCLASSQNFCSTVKIHSVRNHRLCFISSNCHAELMPLKLHFNRCTRQWTKSGCFCCYVTVFSQPSIVIQWLWQQLFLCIMLACMLLPSQEPGITSKLTRPFGSLLAHPSLRK